MLRRATASLALLAAISLPAGDRLLARAAAVEGVDRVFAEDAAKAGRAELRLAGLAESRAAGAAVRALARHIGRDHWKAHEELRAIARQKQLRLDEEPTDEQLATWLRLDQLEGAAFDEAYVAVMLEAHTRTIDAFERYALEGTDDDLKAFADRMLATLRVHLSAAGEARVCAHPKS